jgi:hypothetical protein
MASLARDCANSACLVTWSSFFLQDYEDLLASGKKVAIKFWAGWCNKCKMISPLVDELQVSKGFREKEWRDSRWMCNNIQGCISRLFQLPHLVCCGK